MRCEESALERIVSSELICSFRITRLHLNTIDDPNHRLEFHAVRFICKKAYRSHHILSWLHHTTTHDLVLVRLRFLADQRSICEQTVGAIPFLQGKLCHILFLLDRS